MMEYMKLFDSCIYAFDGQDNIMEEKDLDITSDISSILTPEHSVTKVHHFQGIPLTARTFTFDVRIDGERVRATSWKWLPNAIWRKGECKKFSVESVTAMVPGTRAFVMKITVKSKLDEDNKAPIAVMYRGHARYHEDWRFYYPPEGRKNTRDDFKFENNILTGTFEDAAFCG